jgi:poly(ADP-ribose) glycohydrolase ARH3
LVVSFVLEAKYIGGMIGSALGDAIGEIAYGYRERRLLSTKIDGLVKLSYTDDTAMAIGLAESIKKMGRIDQKDLGETFRRNYAREPWRGYAQGPPTLFALVARSGISYPEAARRLFGGSGSLGNGAAMRIVPVGLFFHNSPQLYEQACAAAEVTHAHPVGMDGAAVQALAVARAVMLDPKETFPLESFIRELIEFARTREIREKMVLVGKLMAQEAPPAEAADRLGRTVAVHESMPFAIYSFLRHPKSFEACLFCAVLHGGDRDTLGAMACAISGAYLGIDGIPSAWREKLENRAYIEDLAIGLAEIYPENIFRAEG